MSSVEAHCLEVATSETQLRTFPLLWYRTSSRVWVGGQLWPHVWTGRVCRQTRKVSCQRPFPDQCVPNDPGDTSAALDLDGVFRSRVPYVRGLKSPCAARCRGKIASDFVHANALSKLAQSCTNAPVSALGNAFAEIAARWSARAGVATSRKWCTF